MGADYSDLYQALCLTISGRAGQVDWSGWSVDAWSEFYDLAQAQGVAPLVHWTFKDNSWPIGSPKDVQKNFSKAYYETAAYNQLLYHELERILIALQEEGIPIVVLKGAALAISLYQDIGLRPMNDLDLLIHPEQLDKTIRIFEELGYIYQVTTHHSLLQGGRGLFVNVELHWSLITKPFDRGKSALLWFWENTEVLNQFSDLHNKCQFTLSLNPTGNLVYLSSHLVEKHGLRNGQLLWFYDLFLLLEYAQNQLKLENLADFVLANRLEGALNQAIVNTHKKFNHSLPLNLDDLFMRGGLDKFPLRTYSQNIESVSDFRRIFYAIRYLDMRTRIKSMFSIIFPNPDYMCWRYGKKKTWRLLFYYPYRWYRLLIDYFIVT